MDVQIINGSDGRPAYAVLSWADYQALAEDAGDGALIDAARKSGGANVSDAELKRMIAGTSPITIFRERRSMTQAELAEAVGSSPAYISQLETGARNAGKKLHRAIAGVLGVEVDDLS